MPKLEQKRIADQINNYIDAQLYIKTIGVCEVSSVTYSNITNNVYVNLFSINHNKEVKINAIEFLELVA
jgi:hypothetical protein